MNAYELDLTLRDYLHGGNYSALRRLRALNRGHRKLCNRIMEACPAYYTKKTTLTYASEGYALPWDCYKVRMVQDADGERIPYVGLEGLRENIGGILADLFPARRGWYQLGTTLYVTPTTFTEDITIYYARRIPDLNWGTAESGSTTSITLDADMSPSGVDDYYTDVEMDFVSGTGAPNRVTITDYVGSTRVASFATVADAPGADTVYGTLSAVPSDFSHLIALYAAVEGLLTDVAQVKKIVALEGVIKEEEATFLDWVSDIQASDGRRVVLGEL